MALGVCGRAVAASVGIGAGSRAGSATAMAPFGVVSRAALIVPACFATGVADNVAARCVAAQTGGASHPFRRIQVDEYGGLINGLRTARCTGQGRSSSQSLLRPAGASREVLLIKPPTRTSSCHQSITQRLETRSASSGGSPMREPTTAAWATNFSRSTM